MKPPAMQIIHVNRDELADLIAPADPEPGQVVFKGELGRIDDGFRLVDTVLPARIIRTFELSPVEFSSLFDEMWERDFNEAPAWEPQAPPWPLRQLTAAIRFGALEPHHWKR